jgi:hypothetical protein
MSDDKFTGGDTLQPGTMEYYTHRAMMRNELSNGAGAYQISNAELASSGPSFGPFQYDVGANPHGRDLFESIAANARDAGGNRIVSDEDLAAIKAHLYKPFNEFTAEDRAVYARMKPVMNQALSSSEGVASINADYLPKVQAKVDAMNEVVNGIGNEVNRAFLQGSPLAKLIVIDTANQYGQAVNDGLKEFAGHTKDDPAMDMPGRGGAGRRPSRSRASSAWKNSSATNWTRNMAKPTTVPGTCCAGYRTWSMPLGSIPSRPASPKRTVNSWKQG